MKTLALSLLLSVVASVAQAEPVRVDRKDGKICYRLDVQGICVADVDAPTGLSFTMDNTNGQRWTWVNKGDLGGALTRDSIGAHKLDTETGFSSALRAINTRRMNASVTVSRPAGKICYRHEKQSLCVADSDNPPGVSFTNDTSAGGRWDYIAAAKLELPLTKSSLGQNQFDRVEGFMGAMALINAKAAFKSGAAFRSLQLAELP